jgi:hypothetical protein
MRVSFLAATVLAAAGVMFYLGTPVHAAKAAGAGSSPAGSSQPISAAHKPLPLKLLSLPLVFEPNQGQTAPQVKYLAHGAGYGLFLTADETVLSLQRSAAKGQPSPSSVIRMRLDGANSAAQISAAQPLPGKSSYFIGNNPAKWRRDIPQFGRVEYTSVYPGVDLVYYGHEGQLEYDFRVAPGADTSQIALSFDGASAHIDAGNSGDLILSTANGDVHFHAPHIYQPAAADSGNTEKTITGSFRQLADNKIGFTIGNYDHSRELVIDPKLTYSTYLGGSGTEGFVHVAVDSGLNIYLTGATNSTDFPVTNGSTPAGTQNLFISKINPQNAGTGSSQLVYSIYLGGSGVDTPAGIQVDSNFGIYVAGSTSSPNFPTTASNAINFGPVSAGTHGFLSKISAAQTPTSPPSLVYTLTYSTYLAGNGTDNVTGIAIDATNQNAYVTGDTTSNNVATSTAPFPANANGYQTSSNAAAPGDPQFFASQINTSGSGPQSMLYSTYFGGGNPAGAIIAGGGGIAVTPAATGVSMFFTGTTNMLPLAGPNGQVAFPLLNAQQACLNEPPNTTCATATPTSITDAFVAQINPNNNGVSSLVYSTYLGGSGTDTGLAIAVDTLSSAYVVGSTNSNNWICSGNCVGGFQAAYAGVGGNTNGYIAKIGGLVGSNYPLSYFTYLGGSGPDKAQAVQVDGNQNAYVAGNTASPNLPVTTDALQAYGGGGDAFAALISTTLAPTAGPPPAPPAGDYLTYLGGSNLDQGTGIAIDTYNAAYVAGNTLSTNFPVTPSTAYQPQLNAGSQDAFVSKIGSVSQLVVTAAATSPLPNPVASGTQVAFTFSIVNNGPDNAANVNFYGTVPTAQLTGSPTAKLTSGTGNCAPVQGSVVPCFIPSLAVGGTATVEVDVTPSTTVVPPPLTIAVSGAASANNGALQSSVTQQASVVDFTVQVGQPNPNSIYAGNPTQIQVQFCPTVPSKGYSGTITPSETTSPSMVTATTPSFNPTTVTLSGNGCGSTVLSIATVARPVNTGSLLRRSSFYATWLPIVGLSLMGLGMGATRRRRRWLIGSLLGLVVGIIMLLPSCGSTNVSANPTGGTLAGNYNIIVTGSAGTGSVTHQGSTILTVN